MSNLDICAFAHEGKYKEVYERIEAQPNLVRKKDQNERIALHWASSGGHTELVSYLLKHGSPVDDMDDCGWTPLMIAASAGRTEIASNLIAHNADVNACNFNGQTPLHYAASRDRYEIAEILIEHGADMNAQDKTSKATPLHRAASRGHVKIVKLLLDAKCNIQTQDAEGNTALHMACEEERSEIAVVLVEHGADLSIQNKAKQKAVDLAQKGLARQLVHLSDMTE
ncbi:26S proteasome non-ATPase regulatory subunit 10 [Exaiptasia diaphana]|uniref:26S proteasome non-ATPase regulatory subunit 10 n=1 Tax=Exaiptasia diaphana TaxID=2652724 RepID=A0A913XDU3_EXADI|nr:26S proteasome non-ATPase regulatory subunit 10-like [Exaiptasia diaphana]XP_020903031.1 26S proteasome non-ATPase regulatory subunit 10 [Exaiptasia diaphana]KXJ20435.1 26S proteasome non-ATPase regulatory subunit 10 [Exaiptasia diaphana]